MNTHILIHAVVQQTMVFVAQLATAGGVRAPLAKLAHQVLLDLSRELQNQGVKKNVIADMFGMSLRTYHRKLRALTESQTVSGRTIWEAVLDYLRDQEPVSAYDIHRRFSGDDRDVIAGVLTDLVHSGLAYRSGSGSGAVYRLADDSDFAKAGSNGRDGANEYLVWHAVYRNGPVTEDRLVELTGLDAVACGRALAELESTGRVSRESSNGRVTFSSDRLEVPVGQAQGWETAVFDHFQAMVSAISTKLSSRSLRSDHDDVTGGATYSIDIWPGHPLEREALGTLARVRALVEDLRDRVDATNAATNKPTEDRVIFYMGQYVKSQRDVVEFGGEDEDK
jgi:transcription initiation factor IIE alpha subunit